MLHIRVPPGNDAARRYAVDVVMGTFLGQAVVLEVIAADDGREFEIADVLLATTPDRWLHPDTVPSAPPPT
jgi:hypothetical protein